MRPSARSGRPTWPRLTAAFFTGIELNDAYAPRYGFSVGDVVANLTGEALALGVLLCPGVSRSIAFKVVYFPSRDFRRAVASGAPLNVAEDYSGQTDLLAFHLRELPWTTGALIALRYLDLSLGYGTRGYEPPAAPGTPLRQLTSLGVSFDLQSVFDDVLGGSPGPSTLANALHFVNDVYQPPATRAPLIGYERVGPRR